MPDTESVEMATGSTTLISPVTASSSHDRGVVDRLTPAESPDSRIEAWHLHVTQNADELNDEMVRAREILHTGTAIDAIELANENVPQRAAAAAASWRATAEPLAGN